MICSYCGVEWGNRETSPGSGIYVGGVHWCGPMIAHMEREELCARQKQEADPAWQAEQRKLRREREADHKRLVEGLKGLSHLVNETGIVIHTKESI